MQCLLIKFRPKTEFFLIGLGYMVQLDSAAFLQVFQVVQKL